MVKKYSLSIRRGGAARREGHGAADLLAATVTKQRDESWRSACVLVLN